MSMLLCLLPFCGLAAIALICGLLAWPYLVVIWPSIREEIERFRRLHPLAKVAALVFIAGFIAYGSTKTNQVDQTSGTNEVEIVGGGGETNSVNLLCPPPPLFSTCYPAPTVTPEDIARGWQLWDVRTNCNISYVMPPGATLATNWWVRGAYEDVKEIGLGGAVTTPVAESGDGTVGGWRFLFGTNEYNSAWAFSWGKLRFALGDTNSEIVTVGAPMSAVPYHSRLWTSAATNGSRLITWEDFVLGRVRSADYQLPSTNYQLVSAQIELQTTGDFTARSNEVETVYRRVDPEDWDGDGWRNDDDPDPYTGEEFGDYFYQELPDGANEDAYCWVDIRPRWNSDIWFYGDAPSDLDDPYIYGAAGETYRVQLLIGKTYDVEGSQPFDIVAKSDERIEVLEYDENECEIVWPVEFTVAEGRAPTGRPRLGATWNDGGKSFYVMPNSPWLRGVITWSDEICCGVWGDGTNFTYACDNECTCEGCTVYGSYWYEGYALPVWGISCGCHYVEDHGPTELSLTFDKSAAIYEEDYTNSPGVVVHTTPSNVVLRCEVYGGTYGGRLTVTLNAAGHQKIAKIGGNALPNNVLIQPDATRVFETVYTPLEPSDSVNDIVATATFVEDFTHDEYEPQIATLTSVKVELTPEDLPPENPAPHRHIMGIAEKVNYSVLPNDVEVNMSDGTMENSSFDIRDSERYFFCPWTGGVYSVVASIGNADYSMTARIVEPIIECRGVALNEALANEVGVAGNVGMLLSLYLQPRTVSFEWILMEEIPVPATEAIPRTGYFLLMPQVAHVTHDGDMGAGRWSQPRLSDGSWTHDRAQMPVECPPLPGSPTPVWADGWMRWLIPVGCGDANCVLRRRLDPDPTDQVYEINANGTVTVRKYGHKVERAVNGRIWLDERLVR